MEVSKLKKGDRVKIVTGPIDKVGLIGSVETLLGNGAIVKLGKNWFTPIKNNHLKKLDNGDL
ncbi:hypothetical protein IH981_02140 [Patescibacteria group bacterium]|nr:hypothetical protein [Patescibacteria group bacterium]